MSTDIHSHLIPGVDDGTQTLEESIELIQQFQSLGYSRLITTPHISETYYPNTVERLRDGYNSLLAELQTRKIEMEISLGAEYMIDGLLLETLREKKELLSWDGHLLIEMSFQGIPMILDEVIYEIQQRGLIVVLAHPERYPAFFDNQSRLIDLFQAGVHLQVNIGSLAGQYGALPKKIAKRLLEKNLIQFVGSDLHRSNQMVHLKKGLAHRALRNFEFNPLQQGSR